MIVSEQISVIFKDISKSRKRIEKNVSSNLVEKLDKLKEFISIVEGILAPRFTCI